MHTMQAKPQSAATEGEKLWILFLPPWITNLSSKLSLSHALAGDRGCAVRLKPQNSPEYFFRALLHSYTTRQPSWPSVVIDVFQLIA